MYACLGVNCHLHFWQNDRSLLRATAVTRGWNGHLIRVSTQSWLWRRKSSRQSSRDSNSQPFDHESGTLTNMLSRLPWSISGSVFIVLITVQHKGPRDCASEQMDLPAQKASMNMLFHFANIADLKCIESASWNHIYLRICHTGMCSRTQLAHNCTKFVEIHEELKIDHKDKKKKKQQRRHHTMH